MHECSVNGCNEPVKRPTTGLCYGHYMKNWRYGTPTPVHRPRVKMKAGTRFGALVARTHLGAGAWLCECDCGRSRVAKSGELNRGSAITCGDRAVHYRQDYVVYYTAHDRVRSDRGKAGDYRCIDCGAQADHWSYNHQDPNELYSDSPSSLGAPYSLDVDNYDPRCITCHRRFDLAYIRAKRSA